MKTDYDVVVVGAGPVGSKTAELLARNNTNVLLIEEHEKIGIPIQCTGINSHRILQLSEASKKIIVNQVNTARFYSSDGNYLQLKSKKPVYVIDRSKLDKEIADRAKKAGADILTSTKFLNFTRLKDYLRIETNRGKIDTKILIGADGPNSSVAKASGIRQPSEYVIGYQETIKDDFSDNIVEMWFGKKITPDFFAWVVPENKKWARVGIAAKSNVIQYYRNFIKNRFGEIEKKHILGGIIRYGLIETSVADNVLLVGDATCQVKPYSGGGVIYGLICSRFAANACLKSLNEKKFNKKFLEENYDKKWKEKLGPAINKGMMLHRMLHSLPDWALSLSVTLFKPFSSILNNLDMDLISD